MNPLWKESGVISPANKLPVMRMKNGCDVWTDPEFKQHKLKDHPHDAILEEGIKILHNLGIFCWVSAGTALGLYRDGHLIENDADIDIAIYGKDYTEKIAHKFFEHDFNLIRAADKDNKPQQRAWQKNDVVFDLACFYDTHDGYYTNYMDYSAIRKPIKLMKDCQDITYKGHQYRIPSPKEYFLWRYGKDWKIPHKTKGLWAKAMAVGK